MKSNNKTFHLFCRLAIILALAFTASSCETRGQKRAALTGGVIGAVAVGAATDSWLGAAAGGAAGAAIGSRVNKNRAYKGKRRLFY